MSLNPFQWLAAIVLVGLIGVTIIGMTRRIVSRREAFFVSLLWIGVGVAVLFPNITVVVARALGIGRGADLVSYCAVVLMLVGFTMVYVRLRRLRRELSQKTDDAIVVQRPAPVVGGTAGTLPNPG